MDKARQKTDKQLKQMERDMSRVYKNDPALIAAKKKYDDYMAMVERETHLAFTAYQQEEDVGNRLKLRKAYTDQLEGFTTGSKEYHKIVDEFITVLAQVNQKALNIANAKMRKIYVDNYNEVASDCRKVGIKVNGKK